MRWFIGTFVVFISGICIAWSRSKHAKEVMKVLNETFRLKSVCIKASRTKGIGSIYRKIHRTFDDKLVLYNNYEGPQGTSRLKYRKRFKRSSSIKPPDIFPLLQLQTYGIELEWKTRWTLNLVLHLLQLTLSSGL